MGTLLANEERSDLAYHIHQLHTFERTIPITSTSQPHLHAPVVVEEREGVARFDEVGVADLGGEGECEGVREGER